MWTTDHQIKNHQQQIMHMTVPNNFLSQKNHQQIDRTLYTVNPNSLVYNRKNTVNHSEKNGQNMMNRTVFSPSFMNTSYTEDSTSFSIDKKKVKSVMPVNPSLPLSDSKKFLPVIFFIF